MVLKTRPGQKLDLPLVPSLTRFLTGLAGFYWFWGLLPDQIGAQFLVELIGLTGPVQFSKLCLQLPNTLLYR